MHRFRKLVTALGVGLISASLVLAPAAAQTSSDLEGESETLRDGGELGYYIWYHDGEFKLRTTGPGPRHVFRARLRTDGEFKDVELVRLEGDDGFSVLDGGHTLELRFETWSHVDGVNFKLVGADRLRFKLKLDGELADTDQIFLGKDGKHPPRNPFTIKRWL